MPLRRDKEARESQRQGRDREAKESQRKLWRQGMAREAEAGRARETLEGKGGSGRPRRPGRAREARETQGDQARKAHGGSGQGNQKAQEGTREAGQGKGSQENTGRAQQDQPRERTDCRQILIPCKTLEDPHCGTHIERGWNAVNQ